MAIPTEDEKQELRRQAEAMYPPPEVEIGLGNGYAILWHGEDADSKKKREALIQKEYERRLYDKFPAELAFDAAGSCFVAILSLVGLAVAVWFLGLLFR